MGKGHHLRQDRRRTTSTCEPLEGRLLLAVIQWRFDVSGDFHDPNNWIGGVAPGPNDDVIITGLRSDTVRLTQPASIRSFTFDGDQYSGGTFEATAPLTIAAESRIGTSEQRNTSIARYTFRSSSTIDGPGLLRVNAEGQLILNNGTVNAPMHVGSRLRAEGTSFVNGPLTTNGVAGTSVGDSSISVVATESQPAHLTIANGYTNTSNLTLDGPAKASATLTVINGALVNRGIISIDGPSSLSPVVPRVLDAELVNQGSIHSMFPAVLRRSDADHVNSGIIRIIENGRLIIEQSGGVSPSFTNLGTFEVSSYAYRDALTINGGAVEFGVGGRFTASAAPTNPLALNDVVLNLAGDFTTQGQTTATRTTIDGPGKWIIPPGGNLTLHDAEVNTSVENSGTLTANNTRVAGPLANLATTVAHGSTEFLGKLSGPSNGTLRVRSQPEYGAADVLIDGSYANAGTLELGGTSPLPVRLRVRGDFTNGRTLDMSDRSLLVIDGNFTQSGSIASAFGGTERGQFGEITAAGAVSLAGHFTSRLAGGFTPSTLYAVPFITGASRTGAFYTVSAYDLGPNTPHVRYTPATAIYAVGMPKPRFAPDLVIADDTGRSNTDNVTNKETLTFTGEGPVGSVVRLMAGQRELGSTFVTSGSWSITTPPLEGGEYRLNAVSVDEDGDAAYSSSTTVRVDHRIDVDLRPVRVSGNRGLALSLELEFGESVYGLDPSDLSLSRDGGPNRLTAQQLLGADGYFNVYGTADITREAGTYTLSLAETSGITDAAGNQLGAASSTWVNSYVEGTRGADEIRLLRDEVDEHLVHVFIGDQLAPAVQPSYSVRVSGIPSLQLTGSGSDGQIDSLVVDFSNGAPGNGAVALGDDWFAPDRLVLRNVRTDEALTVTGSGVNIGSYQITRVGSVGTTTFSSTVSHPAIEVSGFSLADGTVFDLADGTLVVRGGGGNRLLLESLTAAVRTARNKYSRPWTGPGLTSSAAAADPLTTLAVDVLGDDIVVKHTYNGDANLDGKVNADDYFRIDSGFLAPSAEPRFADGDFNYDGKINADDYFLIDSAFLSQGAALTADLPSAAVSASTQRITRVVADDESARPRRRARRGEPVRGFDITVRRQVG